MTMRLSKHTRGIDMAQQEIEIAYFKDCCGYVKYTVYPTAPQEGQLFLCIGNAAPHNAWFEDIFGLADQVPCSVMLACMPLLQETQDETQT